MRKLFKGISLTWSMLKKLAKPHRKMLGVQTLVYSLILCYNVVIVPLIISRVYQALEMQDAKELYITCMVGSLLILVSFILCYLNNVYLDLNSFRISLTAAKNACLSLFSLNYDKMNVDYTEGEIQNRISAGVDQIAGVFPLLVSVEQVNHYYDKAAVFMNKVLKRCIIAGLSCAAGAALLAGCGGGDKQFLNIATGGTAGTYYPLGGAVAEILRSGTCAE